MHVSGYPHHQCMTTDSTPSQDGMHGVTGQVSWTCLAHAQQPRCPVQVAVHVFDLSCTVQAAGKVVCVQCIVRHSIREYCVEVLCMTTTALSACKEHHCWPIRGCDRGSPTDGFLHIRPDLLKRCRVVELRNKEKSIAVKALHLWTHQWPCSGIVRSRVFVPRSGRHPVRWASDVGGWLRRLCCRDGRGAVGCLICRRRTPRLAPLHHRQNRQTSYHCSDCSPA